MTHKTKVSINFVPPAYLLTAILIILKALGYIQWSWWWVFAPVWLSLLLLSSLLVVVVLIHIFLGD